MNVEDMPLDSLKPYPNNPRTIPQEAVAAVARSIQAFGFRTPIIADGENVIITVVDLDPYHAHHGWISLDLDALGIDPEAPFQVHDLLSNARFLWQGPHNYVMLDPGSLPAHILRLQRKVRTEKDFNYYL